MRLRAMAKINLGLDVLRKREDGYHEVRMIMQTIQMYDLLDIRKKEEPGISLSTNLPYVPSDERNLVYKAAKLLMDEFDIKEGLSMKLTKFIPVAAGMAGGSSDAAAAFVGVNRLFRLGLSEEELMKRAVQVGGKPGINVSTKLAYENLHLDQIQSHPDIDGMISDIENQDLHSLTAKMQNVFEPGIISQYPVIQEIKDLMEANGALKAMMSGSGPTVFGIFDDRSKLREATEALRNSHLAKTVFATQIYNKK